MEEQGASFNSTYVCLLDRSRAVRKDLPRIKPLLTSDYKLSAHI